MKRRTKTLLVSGLLLPFAVGILVELFTTVRIGELLLSVLDAIASLATIPIALPLWMFLLVILCSFIAPLTFLAWIVRSSPADPIASYTGDSFFGFDWEWENAGGRIDSIYPICPRCKYQPVFREHYFNTPYGTGEGCKLKCDHCGYFQEFDEPETRLLDRVTREIHRKIRIGGHEKK